MFSDADIYQSIQPDFDLEWEYAVHSALTNDARWERAKHDRRPMSTCEKCHRAFYRTANHQRFCGEACIPKAAPRAGTPCASCLKPLGKGRSKFCDDRCARAAVNARRRSADQGVKDALAARRRAVRQAARGLH